MDCVCDELIVCACGLVAADGVCICARLTAFWSRGRADSGSETEPEAAWQHARFTCMLCGGLYGCCVCLCNEMIYSCNGPLIPQLVSRPTSAARAPSDHWAADGSSTSPPPTPSLTHSSERHVFSSKSLLHSKLSVLCEWPAGHTHPMLLSHLILSSACWAGIDHHLLHSYIYI
jgi:hypothetical protein